MHDKTLAYFDTNKDSVLQVDNSHKGLGAGIVFDAPPIAFDSKSITDADSRYANIELELIAVFCACQRFHTYLYGKQFVMQSDQKPLEMIQLKNIHAAPQRLQRMLLRLQNYTIRYHWYSISLVKPYCAQTVCHAWLKTNQTLLSSWT